jgi:hypothetical protein
MPAIAVLGSNPVHLRPWLFMLNRRIIAVRDGDDACKLQAFADESIDVIGYKDLGDASEEEVERIIRETVRTCSTC